MNGIGSRLDGGATEDRAVSRRGRWYCVEMLYRSKTE